jgi:hypothetical protein
MKVAEGTSEKNVLAFKEQADRIESQMEDFNRYVEDLQSDIERRAGEFSYTEDYESSLRDRHSKDAVMSLKAIDALDERRKVLLAANPYIAEKAKLPPEATVNSDQLYSRLGKDLCVAATGLVDAIGTELKEEEQAKEEELKKDNEISDSSENENNAQEEKSDVEDKTSVDGESVESAENDDKIIESNSDDEKTSVEGEGEEDKSDKTSDDVSDDADELDDDEADDESDKDDDELGDDDELDDDDESEEDDDASSDDEEEA